MEDTAESLMTMNMRMMIEVVWFAVLKNIVVLADSATKGRYAICISNSI